MPIDRSLDLFQQPDEGAVLEDAEIDRVLRHQVLHVQDVRNPPEVMEHGSDDPERQGRRVRQGHVHVLHEQRGQQECERIEHLPQPSQDRGSVRPVDGEIRDPDHADTAQILREHAKKRSLSRAGGPRGGRRDHRDPMSTLREGFRELPHEQRSGADLWRKDGREHQDVHAQTSATRPSNRSPNSRPSNALAIRALARPSPKGLLARAIRPWTSGIVRSSSTASTIPLTCVPTTLATPASTASGRSVVSRTTRTGFPSAGASSCTPPESVTTRCAPRRHSTKSTYPSGSRG